MSISYSEKFNVLEVFEQNDYQKIMMGAKKDSKEDVVVINIFKKGEHLNEKFIKDLSSLKSLEFFDENDEEVTIATSYSEGMSISKYLESTSLTIDERKDISLKYLRILKNYENFDNYFLGLFAESKQLILSNEIITFNEILILNDDIKEPKNFDYVSNNISSTLEKILLYSVADDDEFDKPAIKAFLSKIKSYETIDGIYAALVKDALKNDGVIVTPEVEAEKTEDKSSLAAIGAVGAIGAMGVAEVASAIESPAIEETPSPKDIVEPKKSEEVITPIPHPDDDIAQLFNNDEDEKQKNRKGIWLLLVLLLMVVAIFAKFVIFKPDNSLPIASFERMEQDGKMTFKNTSTVSGNRNIKSVHWTVESDGEKLYESKTDYNIELKFKNDGTFKVTLKVEDNKGNWSKPYSQEFDYTSEALGTIDDLLNPSEEEKEVNETLNRYSIALEDGDSFDSEIKKNGSKSIKLDFTNKPNNKAHVSFKNIFIDENYIISMWICSDGTEPINIQFTGYNNGTVKFVKSKTHNPTAANIWEMIEVSGDSKLIDQLELSIVTKNNTVWLDDIELKSYK